MTTNREQLIKEIRVRLQQALGYDVGFMLDCATPTIASFIQQRDKQIWDAAREKRKHRDRKVVYDFDNYPTLESYLTSPAAQQNKE